MVLNGDKKDTNLRKGQFIQCVNEYVRNLLLHILNDIR